jgi:hypothetical protein
MSARDHVRVREDVAVGAHDETGSGAARRLRRHWWTELGRRQTEASEKLGERILLERRARSDLTRSLNDFHVDDGIAVLGDERREVGQSGHAREVLTRCRGGRRRGGLAVVRIQRLRAPARNHEDCDDERVNAERYRMSHVRSS